MKCIYIYAHGPSQVVEGRELFDCLQEGKTEDLGAWGRFLRKRGRSGGKKLWKNFSSRFVLGV